jgi:hypothetical protein
MVYDILRWYNKGVKDQKKYMMICNDDKCNEWYPVYFNTFDEGRAYWRDAEHLQACYDLRQPLGDLSRDDVWDFPRPPIPASKPGVSKADISVWYQKGVDDGVKYMMTLFDPSDASWYPRYFNTNEEGEAVYWSADVTRACYDLSKPIEEQNDEGVWNFPEGPSTMASVGGVRVKRVAQEQSPSHPHTTMASTEGVSTIEESHPMAKTIPEFYQKGRTDGFKYMMLLCDSSDETYLYPMYFKTYVEGRKIVWQTRETIACYDLNQPLEEQRGTVPWNFPEPSSFERFLTTVPAKAGVPFKKAKLMHPSIPEEDEVEVWKPVIFAVMELDYKPTGCSLNFHLASSEEMEKALIANGEYIGGDTTLPDVCYELDGDERCGTLDWSDRPIDRTADDRFDLSGYSDLRELTLAYQ